jgi:hypothetical protein
LVQSHRSKRLRAKTLKGLFLRSCRWLRTLEKLDILEGDFQAIVAANRALLELCVDVIRLTATQGDDGARQMRSWEESAKLRYSKKILSFHQGKPLSEEAGQAAGFIRRCESRIESLRLIYWPDRKSGNPPTRGRHPDRWTQRNLADDAGLADEIAAPAIAAELQMSLQQFYETEYPRLCWSVHGSGLTVERTDDPVLLVGTGVVSAVSSANLAMLCGRIVLTDFKLFESLESRWVHAHNERNYAHANARGYIPPSIRAKMIVGMPT